MTHFGSEEAFQPDYGCFALQETGVWSYQDSPPEVQSGDRLVLMGDGLDALSDVEILAALKGKNDRLARNEMFNMVEKHNNQGSYMKTFLDGETIPVCAPIDNATVLVATIGMTSTAQDVREVLKMPLG